MKKFFSWIVCAVLLIFAVLIPQFNPLKMGKGNGISKKVENVDDMADILCTLGNNSGAATRSMSDKIDEETAAYESVTLDFQTKTSINIQFGLDKSLMDMQKQMTMYIQEDKIYYKADANIVQSSFLGSKVNKNGISMAFELYFDDEMAVMKINRCNMAVYNNEDKEEKAERFPQEMLNKWVNIGSYASLFQWVNSSNLQTMSVIGEYILSSEENIFFQEGGIYTLGDLEAKKLCNKIVSAVGVATAEENFKEAEFSVNLSSKQSPFFSLFYTVSEQTEKQRDEFNKAQYSYYAGEQTTCRLSNIDNTVVNFPENIEIYDFE